jgi:hypothetical protein
MARMTQPRSLIVINGLDYVILGSNAILEQLFMHKILPRSKATTTFTTTLLEATRITFELCKPAICNNFQQFLDLTLEF